MKEELLTTEQLMELLNVSRTTIYFWRKDGLPYKKVGRSIRFDYTEVRQWIDDLNANREE